MPACPYIRRRNARHHLRIRIPYHLRTGSTGAEITRALGTSDPQVARRRAALAVAAIQAGFAIMEQVQRHGALDATAQDALLKTLVERALEDPGFLLEQERVLSAIDDPHQLRRYVQALAAKAAARLEASTAEETQARAEAADARQAREAAEARAARSGDQAETLRHTVVQLAASGAAQAIELYEGHDQVVSALMEAFLAAKAFKPKTEASYRKAFERLIALVPDKPVSEITKNDCVRFVADLEATRSDKRGRAPLAPATTKKYLSHLCTFFAEQLAKNRIRYNPAAGVGVTRRSGAAHEERSPFTPAQMRALLGAPIFRGCKSASRITEPGEYACRDGRFWYGLVMMFSGARNGEVESLQAADIVLYHGIWHIDVHKNTKTRAGQRLIPIHSSLIKMGFLDWVAERREASGDGRLFEKRKYGRIWNEGILVAAGAKTEQTCTYSFRHNFEDGLKEVVQDETKKRLMGHATGAMGGRYGNGQVTRAQAGAIERLDLGEMDFSFLFKYATLEQALATVGLIT